MSPPRPSPHRSPDETREVSDPPGGLAIAPSLGPTLARDRIAAMPRELDRRDAIISAHAVALAFATTLAAEVLVRAIALATNLAYYQRASFATVDPAGHALGPVSVLVPIIGGVIVGIAGSGLGWLACAAVAAIAPAWGIDPRVGALVGMAAMFAGASRALLASIAFALEATHAIEATVPVIAGTTLAFFVSCLLMRTTIMTEKLARRGVWAASEYDVNVASP